MSHETPHLKPAQDAKGLAASPQLPNTVKNYLIDIDGTGQRMFPTKNPSAWSRARPFPMLWKL